MWHAAHAVPQMPMTSTLARTLLALVIYAIVLALLWTALPEVMSGRNGTIKAAFLVIAGPVGAMITHLHTPLFLLLSLVVLPFFIASFVNRARRKAFAAAVVVIWLAMGAGFATLTL